MKKYLKKILPDWVLSHLLEIKKNVFDTYALKSYSQEGEDMILRRIFESKQDGFYVDVGAHHPKRFSNTYIFYKRGWRGINLDAMPGSMGPFNTCRPKDINIECGIGEKEGSLEYFMFNEPALNGFSKKLSEVRNEQTSNYHVIATKNVDVRPLAKVLDQYLPKGQKIDFLNVDVEGLDFEVLRSNDWEKYRPRIVLVEVSGSSLETIMQDEIFQLMKTKGYSIYAKSANTVFFKINE
jgi:FkbM family methyltransferase